MNLEKTPLSIWLCPLSVTRERVNVHRDPYRTAIAYFLSVRVFGVPLFKLELGNSEFSSE